MNRKRRVQRNGLSGCGLLFLVLMFLCVVDHAYAAAPVVPEEANLIQINVESTRPELTVGTGLGIVAEVTNVSKKSVIHLTEKDLTLTPAPELVSATGELVNWWAYFPQMETNKVYNPPFGGEKRWYAVAQLKPGEKITAFWWTASRETPGAKASGIWQVIRETWATVLTELKFIFFSPGDYKVTVSAKYWVHPQQPESEDYHVAVQSRTFHASAPQSVVLLGAAIGGLLAYFILPQGRQRLIESMKPREQPCWWDAAARQIIHEVGGAVAAILLSTIVTILLSRIAETQFLIRVTVSDIWGAVTVGFVANYAGSTILARILNKVSPSGTGAEVAKPAVPQPGGGEPAGTPKS